MVSTYKSAWKDSIYFILQLSFTQLRHTILQRIKDIRALVVRKEQIQVIANIDGKITKIKAVGKNCLSKHETPYEPQNPGTGCNRMCL